MSAATVPYVLVGDEAFLLKRNMMRPYRGKNLRQAHSVYSYQLSRARRVIENSFGILDSRSKIFRRPMIATPEHVVTYSIAKLRLHSITSCEQENHQFTVQLELLMYKTVMAMLLKGHGEMKQKHKDWSPFKT